MAPRYHKQTFGDCAWMDHSNLGTILAATESPLRQGGRRAQHKGVLFFQKVIQRSTPLPSNYLISHMVFRPLFVPRPDPFQTSADSMQDANPHASILCKQGEGLFSAI